jgi:plasmid segregation protein ParM
MNVKMNFKVSNDNGNSEQELIINGELIRQPNTYSLELEYKSVGEKTIEQLIANLMDNLFVSIESPALSFGGRYYIGKAAIDKGTNIENMVAGKELKTMSDVPVVNTLGNIAGYAVIKAFQKSKKIPKVIEVTADMATALPVTEYKLGTAHVKSFAERFMKGEHQVTVFIGEERVVVTIKFEFVKVLPEGTTTLFFLNSLNAEHPIFADFIKKYELDSNLEGYLKDKRLLHSDIGDGTTENPITKNMEFDEDKADGLNKGIAHAIDQAMGLFVREERGYSNLTRQKFSDYLKYPELYPYESPKSKHYMTIALRPVVKEIMDKIKLQLDRAYNEIDIVVVYGGGSILMRPIMEPLLEAELMLRRNGQIKLLWVPAEYAPLMNVEGLRSFMDSGIFDAVKNKALEKAKA